MNLILRRTRYCADGIFGELLDAADGCIFLRTLEHSYASEDGAFSAKLPLGTYTCVRGQHQLEGMSKPFETFEVTGVPGHTGILFHTGNYNADSAGCILLGKGELTKMITDSRAAFISFLRLMDGLDTFQLTVE